MRRPPSGVGVGVSLADPTTGAESVTLRAGRAFGKPASETSNGATPIICRSRRLALAQAIWFDNMQVLHDCQAPIGELPAHQVRVLLYACTGDAYRSYIYFYFPSRLFSSDFCQSLLHFHSNFSFWDIVRVLIALQGIISLFSFNHLLLSCHCSRSLITLPIYFLLSHWLGLLSFTPRSFFPDSRQSN